MADMIEVLPPCPRYVLRTADPSSCQIALPTTPCRAIGMGDYAVLWVGPDEWLIIGAALVPESETIDVSCGFVAIAVEGHRATELLNTACPLDLHPDAFPVGMCTRTVFAKAQIVLWRTAPERFRIEVARSYGPYLLGLLEQARDCLAALTMTV